VTTTANGRTDRRARRTVATRIGPTVDSVCVGVVKLQCGMASVNALLGGEKTRIQVPGGHGRVTTPYRLNQVVVVVAEAPENEVREIRITKRLPDSRQGVGERLDLIKVDVREGVELLALEELLTKSRGANRLVHREVVRHRRPHVKGRGGKHDQTSDAFSQRGLECRQDGLVLCDSGTVRRVLSGDPGASGRDRRDKAGRARMAPVYEAFKMTAAKER
jgi:hypothetical protein